MKPQAECGGRIGPHRFTDLLLPVTTMGKRCWIKKKKQACATAHASGNTSDMIRGEISPARPSTAQRGERQLGESVSFSPHQLQAENPELEDVYSEGRAALRTGGGFQHHYSTGAVTLHVQQVAGTSFCLHRATQTPRFDGKEVFGSP